jgi:hypothetical protein
MKKEFRISQISIREYFLRLSMFRKAITYKEKKIREVKTKFGK